MRDVLTATADYERWLGSMLPVVPADLEKKHQAMTAAPFPFLRATFYRWVERWPEMSPKVVGALEVLSVGDLHVENFGTWRDAEGRLVWGVNDFDEAYVLPFTFDLVRLAASALLAHEAQQLATAPKTICDALTAGYGEAAGAGGAPFVLSEKHTWLRTVATAQARDPGRFWEKLTSFPDAAPLPRSARRVLSRALPDEDMDVRVVARTAGLGSLGRQRYVAVGPWQGGLLAREAKAITASACAWAGYGRPRKPLYMELARCAVRSHDPFISVNDGWLLRRLSPYCSRIDLEQLPREKDELRLLHAMGWETANIHLGSAKPKRLSAALAALKPGWLYKAANRMRDAVEQDWKVWKRA